MTLRLRGYTEVAVLARGPEGELVEARFVETGQRVAIRHLPAAISGDAAVVRRLSVAVEELSRVDDAELGRPFAVVVHHSQAAVLTELVDGVPLPRLLQPEPLPVEAGLVVLRSVLCALGRLHALGMIHGRFHSGSVVVTPQGRVCVVDGYLAAALDSAYPLPAGRPLAPELARSPRATARTDLYAAAAVFLECVGALSSGQPSEVSSITIADTTVPAPIAEQIRRTLAGAPRRRPKAASALDTTLGAAADAALGPGWADRGRAHLAARATATRDREPTAPEAAAEPRTARRPQPRRLAVVAAVVVLLLAAGVAASALTARPVSAPSSSPDTRVSANPATPRTSGAVAGGTPLAENLTFTGDLTGSLDQARAGGPALPAVCGPQASGSFRFVLTGDLGAKPVTVAAYIAPFGGPGTYGAAPGAAPPATPPAGSPESVALVVTSGNQRWTATEVQITVDPGNAAGTVDARLAAVPQEPAALQAGTVLRGRWTCQPRG